MGRGASIGVMAAIQGGLPESLQTVWERFGGEVALQIIDRRVFHDSKELRGWQHLPLLRSEGSHEHIKQRLHQALEHRRSTGEIDEDAYRQAFGDAPRPKHPGLDSSSSGRNEHHGDGRGGAPQNREEAVLKRSPTATDTGLYSAPAREPTAHQLKSEEKNAPRPGKDIKESLGRDDDYGL
jgi:hypothetical protein